MVAEQEEAMAVFQATLDRKKQEQEEKEDLERRIASGAYEITYSHDEKLGIHHI